MTTSTPVSDTTPTRHVIKGAVVRFAGDSGDGMQVTGDQFTAAAALAQNDLATFPDFPAEIRAPAGTLYGVSGFQIHFSSQDVFTPGDAPDVLVAMNPAALKTNLRDLKQGGLLIVNSGTFNATNLKKAGYAENPLEDGSMDNAGYSVLAIDISKLTLLSVKDTGLSTKEANRCKNFWTLGSDVLDLRAADGAVDQVDREASSASAPSWWPPTSPRSKPATPTAKPPKSRTSATKCPRRPSPRASTATSAATRRRPGA